MGRKHNYQQLKKSLDPNEIFLDDTNLPQFDTQQFEGHIEKPISRPTFFALSSFFIVVALIFLSRISFLEIIKGNAYAERSQNNNLRLIPVFSKRGIVLDRRGEELAWNDPDRVYTKKEGFGLLLGYLGYPDEKQLDKNDYVHKELIGKGGLEGYFNDRLMGQRGTKIEETDVAGKVVSDHVLQRPLDGQDLTVSVDARIQEKLFGYIKQLAIDRGFEGGAGLIMDVHNGELLALVSYPEFDSNVMTKRNNNSLIKSYLADASKPFLNRAVGGLYAPGSIVKPIVAIGALNEGIISPDKKILSTGAISLVNPYDKTKKTVFRDWKAHGWVDMRWALAVSSDVYFYAVGGGYGDQTGLGIARLEKYFKTFGLTKPTGVEFSGEQAGEIPNPAWKEEHFDGEPWRIGDTYHTAIGQYGMMVTPIQMVKATAIIANGGYLVHPTILASSTQSASNTKRLNIPLSYFNIIHDGMRLAVTEGTAKGLNLPRIEVAAKTGTAELGVSKNNVNSWIVGFFPFQQPRYAFAVVMERGPSTNLVGGVFTIRQLLDWMSVYTPEYFD